MNLLHLCGVGIDSFNALCDSHRVDSAVSRYRRSQDQKLGPVAASRQICKAGDCPYAGL